MKQTEKIELIKRNDRLLRSSAEAINVLLADADFGTGISRTLKTIGEAADVDRVYIFEHRADPKTGVILASQRYEWARAGITPQIANPALQNLEYLPVFKRWLETLSAGKPIFGLIRDFPEPERPLLEAQDIISILVVPIKINENLWGFVGFDDCRQERSWTPAEISILTAIAANIGYVLLQKRTEQSLKRLQAAIEGTGDAIGMADMQGHHFYQNKAFTNLFEYTAEELEKAGGPLVAFQDQSVGQEVFKSILAGGSWHGELEMRSRSGRIIPMLARTDAIKGEDGKPFAVIGIFTDITKHKEIETALQKSEMRYRQMIDVSTDYIYTVNVENGRAANTRHGPNCIRITGYSSNEYEADPDLWFRMIHPDDCQMVLEQTQRVLKGETVPEFEHRIYHKNGTIRWVRNTPVPHFDISGNLVSYDGLVCNVTERKNAEEELKEHARKLEILNRIITAVNRVDNLSMLLNELLKDSVEMVSFDGGGIYLVNADKSTAELVSHQGLPDDFLKKAGALKLSAANCRMLFVEGKPIFTDDYSLISSEGDAKWNMRSVARIPLVSKDKIIGALVLVNAKGHTFNENEKELLLSIGRQIGTAIAKMRSEAALIAANNELSTINEHLGQREQELLKANNEKEALLKEIHHRVKNNLQVISSLISLQIHNIADRNAIGLLKECQNRIKTIAMVHEKMYQWGDLARVDIGNYLESLTSHISHMYLADPASVTIRVNAKSVYLPIDQAIPCALIVNELVSNSLKHAFPEHLPKPAIAPTIRACPSSAREVGTKAGKAGEINVQILTNESDNYVLIVSDNGVGLPLGIDCRNTKSLGMQLINTFVSQLHGTLEFANKPGATFKISFAQSSKEN
ncbi:MAG: PAS domain S-box protein [Kiritimatiellia bacterium]|nr:PAS domain S-box protein [Kiritimatiellia bacterium]